MLELAEQYTKEGDIPGELKDAILFYVGKGLMKIAPVADLLDPNGFRNESWEGITVGRVNTCDIRGSLSTVGTHAANLSPF